MSFGIPIIHSILEWKKTIDSKNADANEKSDSVAELHSIYLSSVRDSVDGSERNLSSGNNTTSGEAEGQRSNTTGGHLSHKVATDPDKASSAQSDDIDDEHEEEDPTKDGGSVDGQDKDDGSGSVDDRPSQDDDGVPGDEENAIQSMSINIKRQEKVDDGKQPLLGLVLTPTRELAVQVKHHIDAVAQFTGRSY